MIAGELRNLIAKALKDLGLVAKEIHLEHPEDFSYGDYSSNVAMAQAKALGLNPKELAEKIKKNLEARLPSWLTKIEIAGPGFINFHLSQDFFQDSIKEIRKEKENYGRNDSLKGEKVMVEYTDPNPFKEFHIGHLMSNSIGEAISRLVEFSGAQTRRACYQGDVGMHVAKAVWGILQSGGKITNLIALGQAYAQGTQVYEDEVKKKEINDINKKIYERSDKEINKIYDAGRQLSLDYFDITYKKLGTKFDYFFFESETGKFGKQLVLEFLKKGIFEQNEGAVIFHGEKYDPKLHTRVFLNSEGLPTYEAKELGLAKIKYDQYKYDTSIVITGNEVNEYFKVLLKAMEQVYPELAQKTKHLSHGMLRLPTGKMSSRTGDVITGESLINQVQVLVKEKIKDRNLPAKESSTIATQVAIGAIKYSILKQAPGRDTIFDIEKSISFEGDSGPYLQYAYTRARSVIAKAKAEKIAGKVAFAAGFEPGAGMVSDLSEERRVNPRAELAGLGEESEKATSSAIILERLLYRFPEVVEKAQKEYAPHHVLTYVTNLAQAFNTFYGQEKIVDQADPASPYKVALTEAFSIVLKNGLYLLGIQAPEKM